jgi:hypothetical protein
MQMSSVSHLTDDQLLARVDTLSARECATTAEMLTALAEVDRRRLHLALGFPSLFEYCKEHLHFSEFEAFLRMAVARVAQAFPIVIPMIADGSLTLTNVALLSKHLTADNHESVLQAAIHKTKREVMELIAVLHPRPDAPATITRIGGTPHGNPVDLSGNGRGVACATAGVAPSTPVVNGSSGERNGITPLAAERYKLEVTISREAYEMLLRIQDLMRHAVPDGDPAVIVERSLQQMLADLERRKTARTDRPHRVARCRSGTRYVPAEVRRQVWTRDEKRCAFVGAAGRCRETGRLELHHVIPYADGGNTSVENLELRCRAHNVYEAELHFGFTAADEMRLAEPP